MRFRPKKDLNQDEIVAALREIGATVWITTHMGGGFPDMVVGFRGITTLFEAKYKGGKITPAEAKFFETWHGSAYIVGSPLEAIETLLDITEEQYE